MKIQIPLEGRVALQGKVIHNFYSRTERTDQKIDRED